MSTRSPQNERNTNPDAKPGYMRKSAASAKPARSAASSVRVVPASSKEKRKQAERGESLAGLSKEEKRARKQAERLQEDRLYAASNALMRKDEDYSRRRKFFWVLLAAGLSAIVIVWLMIGTTRGQEMQTTQIVGIVIAYACILGAFIYDLVRIRPIRNACRSKAEGLTEKRLNNLIEKDAAERDAKKAKRESKKK